MADYHWPPADKRNLIGKRISRIDGPWKSSGRIKYTYDVNRPGMLYGRMVISPYAHAKVVSIDTAAAERMPGVKAVQIMFEPGKEVRWAGQEIVAIAAESEDQARDAARKVEVKYERLPHFVSDVEPAKVPDDHKRQLNETVEGNPDQALQQADAIGEGEYGASVITHCCLESHGQVAEWEGDNLTFYATTQSVSSIPGELATGLKRAGINVDASQVRVLSPVMGGGFGSKFNADTWGLACAQLAKKAGRPVKMMLERDQELMVAGARPSIYARVRVGAKKDGTLTGWASESWGTGGPDAQGGAPALPYVFRIPDRRIRHTAVMTNIGPARAWRAPNHPQLCVITMSAIEDVAAKIGMDPLEVFLKNVQLTGALAKTYTEELQKAAQLMDWQKKWHRRGDKTPGAIKRGLGVSIHTWGGAGHASNCNCTINPDGSVEVSLGSQDLGTGTRTVINIVAAETLGLPLTGVKVNIGDSKYPPDGSSGGSTTVGGVSSSTRRAATIALNKLLEVVAPSLDAKPDDLEAVGGQIRVKGNPTKAISWKQACAKLGAKPVSEIGQRQRPQDDLISSGVGGAQMAEVSVDTETGIVKMEKLVAVQDCGLIIDLKTAESQVYGACIMGVTYSLFEEKIMDQQTGRHLNADLEFYKLAGIGDIGEIVVHMMTGPGYDERGVIGLGEPPVISPGAAISNAVANAIGVRVPTLPLTPDKVLAALEKGGRA
jgi:xanthine dehydrogenase YagR molybdenum-binding subunit